jgi:dTDP-4-amino-4,6-dideoxygalactose transaminase
MAKLALMGGPKVLPNDLGVTWPLIEEGDERKLLEVFRSGKWWRGGTLEDQAASVCGAFERTFAAFHDSPCGLAVSNGTVALELALRAAGVQPGDEVIVPALSFVVSASAVLPLGAVPVFADCDPRTFQSDPASIEAAIGPRTRAVVVVHFGGYAADLDRIAPLCQGRGIPLIEDCAHAQGTQWRGRGVGSYGSFGTFSFQQSKSLPCGEGGLVITGDLDRWRALYRYHNLGRLEHAGFYDFHEVSSNFRLTDLQGAILAVQFEKLKRLLPLRMAAGRRLSAALRAIGGVEPLPDDERITRRGYYYYLFRYDAAAFRGVHRERFLQALHAEGLTSVGHSYGRAINTYPLFEGLEPQAGHPAARYGRGACPVAERVFEDELCSLPHVALLADDQTIDRIAEAVRKVKENAEELRMR